MQMFASLLDPYIRLFTGRAFGAGLVQPRPMHQNRLCPDEMPESLKRDLGLIDGRVSRGVPRYEGSAEVLRLIQRQRSL
jgi:hypothetical protein